MCNVGSVAASSNTEITQSTTSLQCSPSKIFIVAIGAITASVGVLAIIACTYPHALGPLNALGRLGKPASIAFIAGGALPIVIIAFLPPAKPAVAEKTTEAPTEPPTPIEEPDEDVESGICEETDEYIFSANRTTINYDLFLETGVFNNIQNQKAHVDRLRQGTRPFQALLEGYFNHQLIPPLALLDKLEDWEAELVGETLKGSVAIQDPQYLARLFIHLSSLGCPHCQSGNVLPQADFKKIAASLLKALPPFTLDFYKNILQAVQLPLSSEEYSVEVGKKEAVDYDHAQRALYLIVSNLSYEERLQVCGQTMQEYPQQLLEIDDTWFQLLPHKTEFQRWLDFYFRRHQIPPFHLIRGYKKASLISIMRAVQVLVVRRDFNTITSLFYYLATMGCPSSTCGNGKKMEKSDFLAVFGVCIESLKPFNVDFIVEIFATAARQLAGDERIKDGENVEVFTSILSTHFISITRMIIGMMTDEERGKLLKKPGINTIALGTGWLDTIPPGTITLDQIFLPHKVF